MSVYELIDYDRLLDRIGIDHTQTWFCGQNPPEEWKYDQEGLTYDDIYPYPSPPAPPDHRYNHDPLHAAYNGRAQRVSGGLCLTGDINVNGLLLNHRDANGTIWLCTEMEGWWTLPPSEIPEVPKPYWDGSLLTTGRYLTRTITISGCFIPPDKSLVWKNRDTILRCASIVRGVGLLAVCGNADYDMSIDIAADSAGDYENPLYDPSKMSIIQMNDVPLIQTTRSNGFTQFSLSFKCVQPTKQSIIEHAKTITVQTADGKARLRQYKSISSTTLPTTIYDELPIYPDHELPRKYADVWKYNPDSLILDEDNEFLQETVAASPELWVNNQGNYFSFPVYVFGNLTGASTTGPLTIENLTTGEKMELIKDFTDPKMVLVVDTEARRVAYVNPLGDASSWSWDDRSYLSLVSDWVSLAPGQNRFLVTKGTYTTANPAISVGTSQPQVYWRDTWIG